MKSYKEKIKELEQENELLKKQLQKSQTKHQEATKKIVELQQEIIDPDIRNQRIYEIERLKKRIDFLESFKILDDGRFIILYSKYKNFEKENAELKKELESYKIKDKFQSGGIIETSQQEPEHYRPEYFLPNGEPRPQPKRDVKEIMDWIDLIKSQKYNNTKVNFDRNKELYYAIFAIKISNIIIKNNEFCIIDINGVQIEGITQIEHFKIEDFL